MNITLAITHDNQNEGSADIIIAVTGISLNMKGLIDDYPSGLSYGDSVLNGYVLVVNPAGTNSMSCNNGLMTLFVDTSNDWTSQEVTIEGYTLADRLSLEERLTQVVRQANGE